MNRPSFICPAPSDKHVSGFPWTVLSGGDPICLCGLQRCLWWPEEGALEGPPLLSQARMTGAGVREWREGRERDAYEDEVVGRMGEPALRQRHGMGGSLRGRCQVSLGRPERKALGALVRECCGHLATSHSTDGAGPLSGACGREQLPRGKGPPSSGNLRHPQSRTPTTSSWTPRSYLCSECASGGRDVGRWPFSNRQIMVTWRLGLEKGPVSRKKTKAWEGCLSQGYRAWRQPCRDYTPPSMCCPSSSTPCFVEA